MLISTSDIDPPADNVRRIAASLDDDDLDDDERQAIAAASQHPPNHPPHLVDESRHPFAAEATDETDGLASHG